MATARERNGLQCAPCTNPARMAASMAKPSDPTMTNLTASFRRKVVRSASSLAARPCSLTPIRRTMLNFRGNGNLLDKLLNFHTLRTGKTWLCRASSVQLLLRRRALSLEPSANRFLFIQPKERHQHDIRYCVSDSGEGNGPSQCEAYHQPIGQGDEHPLGHHLP